MSQQEALNFAWENDERYSMLLNFCLENQSFADVTLVSNDDKEFQAHKFILSAFSEFFEKLLSSRHQQNVILYLSEIPSHILSNILDFVYKGSVNVDLKDINQFIKGGNILKIKGLMTEPGNEGNVEAEDITKNTNKNNPSEEKNQTPELSENKVKRKSYQSSW